MKYSPHPYQKKAMKFMLGQACAGLFLDPGLGKTSITLGAYSVLKAKKFSKGLLIIAPLRACYSVWPAEIDKWDEFAELRWHIVHDKGKADLWNVDADVYLINYEAIPWLAEQLMARRPADWPFDILVCDESTKLKYSQTKRFKAFRPLLPLFRRRYILTGTPAPNGLLDLFGQIYVLDLGHSLGRFITHYRNNYFYPTGYGGYTWVPQLGAMDRIVQRISPLVMRMAGEDYLELPELVNRYTWVELPPAARRTYNELYDQFITILHDEVITAPSAAAAGVKCRQVLNGALYTNAEHDWVEVHDAKIQALKDLAEELGDQPLLVFYEFIHDRERIQRELKWECLGQKSLAHDAKLIDMFNKGLLPGLLAHPASAGHALNLQAACSHICYFGLTWNFEHYDQSIRRVWRQGQKNRVIVHHLCIRDSLDVTVVRTLSGKDRTQSSLQRAIQSSQN